MPPLCSGLARRPLKAVAPVRIRSGVQVRKGALTSGDAGRGSFFVSAEIGLGQRWGNTRQQTSPRPRRFAGPIHRVADLVEPVLEEVAVGVERHRRRAVSEHLLDDLDVGAGRDREAV